MVSPAGHIRKPILLLGSHRSGTTWLGEVFGQAPEVAYWAEPRQVWVYGNWFRPDDVLTAEQARPGVIAHIHKRFDRFAARRGKRLFCEKTPSNCLRIPFLRAVYPEARFIMILRDGRAVLRSTREILQRGGARWQRLWEKLWEATPSEWPAYLEKWPWIASKLTGRTNPFWGTRPAGWQTWFREDPPDVFFAKQWAATMSQALTDFEQLPLEQRRIIRYEELLTAPKAWIDELLQFAGLQDRAAVADYFVDSRDGGNDAAWRQEFSQDELDRVRSALEPTLNRLGYTW